MTAHMRLRPARSGLALGILGLLGCSCAAADAAVRIEGQVQIGGGAVAGSTVTLWAASRDAPARLAQVMTDAGGRFALSSMRRRAALQAFTSSPAAARPPSSRPEATTRDFTSARSDPPAAQGGRQRTDDRRLSLHHRPIHQRRSRSPVIRSD